MKIGPPIIVTPNVKISIIMNLVIINHTATNKIYNYFHQFPGRVKLRR